MGCDIHMCCEIQDTNGKWQSAELYTKSGIKIPIYHCRNYYLFSILANVRNYDGLEYIDEPRGIPENVSQETAEEYQFWVKDAHSASWFTLREIKEFVLEHKNDTVYTYNYNKIIRKITYNDILKDIINRMIWYAKNIFEYKYQNYLYDNTYSDRIRIVFWFDN